MEKVTFSFFEILISNYSSKNLEGRRSRTIHQNYSLKFNFMINKNILDSMSLVFTKSKKSGLNPDLFKDLSYELKLISEHLKITQKQSFIYSVIYFISQQEGVVSSYHLIDYFSTTYSKLSPLVQEIDVLISKNIILESFMNEINPGQVYVDTTFSEIPPVENNYFPEEQKFSNLKKIIDVIQKTGEGWSHEDLFRYTMSFIKTHSTDKIFQIVSEDLFYTPLEQCSILWIIWNTLLGKYTISYKEFLSMIFPEREDLQIHYLQKLVNFEFGEFFHSMTRFGYEFSDIQRFGFSLYGLSLSDSCLKELKSAGIVIPPIPDDTFENQQNSDFEFPSSITFIEPQKIEQKTLIFTEDQARQLNVLKELLKEENFRIAQEKLAANSASRGVLVMLYGSPGTGKTESVYQIAKECKRPVIKVEVSELHGMYWGESEKAYKEVFKTYKSYCENNSSSPKPILLFNEADGVFSRRIRNIERSMDKSNNILLNILLEELEAFDGIFMATTNLTDNFDSAFERRFLYKIELRKPDVKSKTEIWKSRLPKLPIPECTKLASRYDLSGGQIDNVCRKIILNSICNSDKISFEEIETFCKQENILQKDISPDRRQIGFRAL